MLTFARFISDVKLCIFDVVVDTINDHLSKLSHQPDFINRHELCRFVIAKDKGFFTETESNGQDTVVFLIDCIGRISSALDNVLEPIGTDAILIVAQKWFR